MTGSEQNLDFVIPSDSNIPTSPEVLELFETVMEDGKEICERSLQILDQSRQLLLRRENESIGKSPKQKDARKIAEY